jgi:TRAP-type uncharacterized transport system substrate-binding protein
MYNESMMPPSAPVSPENPKRGRLRLPLKIVSVSWADLAESVVPILLLGLVAVGITAFLVRPAPPHVLTMSTGPKGSNFARDAEQYQKILARSRVTLKLVESEGSLENLNRLLTPKSAIDVALVQSGIDPSSDAAQAASDANIALVSLGTFFYQPLTIFYRSAQPIERLSQLTGRRIAIGPQGSGTQFLALALLKGNEIEPNGPTELLSMEADDAKNALLGHKVDAIFLSGDSASPTTIRLMLHTEGIRLFDFPQADAYVRRYPYLNKLALPPGSFDLGENLPPAPINMIAPTVELLAHSELHPALTDLLLEAAFEVHGHATVLQAAGQFPSASTTRYTISDEASRYYKTGNKSFVYRYLPFWLASLLNRALVVIVPVLVVVIPGLRMLPQLYNWRVNTRIHRRYGELMALERESLGPMTDERRAALLDRLQEIERLVIRTRMPGSHAEQMYILRQHISFVRANLERPAGAITVVQAPA